MLLDKAQKELSEFQQILYYAEAYKELQQKLRDLVDEEGNYDAETVSFTALEEVHAISTINNYYK